MQQKYKYILLGTATFFVGVGLALLVHQSPKIPTATEVGSTIETPVIISDKKVAPEKPENSPQIINSPKEELSQKKSDTQKITVTLKLPETSYQLQIPENSSAYDLLEIAKVQKGFSFTAKSFPVMGYLVDSINGIKGGDQVGYYWIYFVNDKEAIVGVSNYKLKDGDVVEWKYRTEN